MTSLTDLKTCFQRHNWCITNDWVNLKGGGAGTLDTIGVDPWLIFVLFKTPGTPKAVLHWVACTIGRSWRMLNINCTSQCIPAVDALETNFSSENILQEQTFENVFLKFWKDISQVKYILQEKGRSRKRVQQLVQWHVILFQTYLFVSDKAIFPLV